MARVVFTPQLRRFVETPEVQTQATDLRAALEAAGFANVAHVVHGFEGELNEQFKRSSVNGWRFEGLPWEQM